MKKRRILFIWGLMLCSLVISACEKEPSTTPYERVNDNDWKKTVTISSESENVESVVAYTIENNQQ